MAGIILALLALNAVYVYADIFPQTNSPECADTELLSLCGKTCQRTCARRENTPCQLDPKICALECRCKDGLYRNEATGACLTRKECTKKSQRYV